jgi:hypothetical protein
MRLCQNCSLIHHRSHINFTPRNGASLSLLSLILASPSITQLCPELRIFAMPEGVPSSTSREQLTLTGSKQPR